jgi:hypothetical protein
MGLYSKTEATSCYCVKYMKPCLKWHPSEGWYQVMISYEIATVFLPLNDDDFEEVRKTNTINVWAVNNKFNLELCDIYPFDNLRVDKQRVDVRTEEYSRDISVSFQQVAVISMEKAV